MSKYLIIVLLIASASASSFKASLSKLGTHGVVLPTNCGGVGNLLETRVSNCNALPCRLTFDSIIEIDFRPSVASANANIRLTLTYRTGAPITESGPIGPVTPGVTNTLTLTELGSPLTEQEVTIKIEIINNANANEICLSGLFNEGVVAPPTTTTTAVPTTTGTGAPPPTTTTTVATTTTAGATGISASITALAIVLLGATQLSKSVLNF